MKKLFKVWFGAAAVGPLPKDKLRYNFVAADDVADACAVIAKRMPWMVVWFADFHSVLADPKVAA